MTIANWLDLRDLVAFAANQISLRIMSSKQEEKIASLIGDMAYTIRKNKRRLTTRALKSVYGDEVSPARANLLVKQIFENAWKDRLVLSAIKRRSTRRQVEIEGIENLQDALAAGLGVIIWESPFGKRLLAKSVLTEIGMPLWQIHAHFHGGSSSWVGQNVVRRMYRRAVSEQCLGIIDIQSGSLGYLRKLVKVLQDQSVLCVMSFASIGQNHASVKLLGSIVELPTGIVSLARMTEAPIVPVFCFSDGNGRDKLVIESPIRIEATDVGQEAVTKVIQKYNDLLESYIVRYPDQWPLWSTIPGRGPARRDPVEISVSSPKIAN